MYIIDTVNSIQVVSITLPENLPSIGFLKMKSKDQCMEVINTFNGKLLDGARYPLKIKFADTSERQ